MSGLKNFGAMAEKQLRFLLDEFETLEGVKVSRGNILCTVVVKKTLKTVLSAALIGNKWHVRSVPGLIVGKHEE